MTPSMRAALTDHRNYWLTRAQALESTATIERAFGRYVQAAELERVADNYRAFAYGIPRPARCLERE